MTRKRDFHECNTVYSVGTISKFPAEMALGAGRLNPSLRFLSAGEEATGGETKVKYVKLAFMRENEALEAPASRPNRL